MPDLCLCDNLSLAEVQILQKAFLEAGLIFAIEGLYWLEVPENYLEQIQKEHQRDCGPYLIALEFNQNLNDQNSYSLTLDELLRAKHNLHCQCIAPLTAQQQDYAKQILKPIWQKLALKNKITFKK